MVDYFIQLWREAMPVYSKQLSYASDNIERVRELLGLTSRMARIGVYELDLLTNSLFWSAVTREIHEVADDFVPTLGTAVHFYHPDDQPRIERMVDSAIRDGMSFDEQLRIQTAKGNTCWVRVVGMPEFRGDTCIRLYGTFHDITLIKEVEQAISEQKHYTDSILRAIPDMIFVFNSDGDYLEFRSGDMSDLLVDPTHFLGKHCSQVLPAAISEMLMEGIRLTSHGLTPLPFEYALSCKGKDHMYEARISPLSDRKVIVLVRNITLQHAVQDELNHIRTVLEHTSRIARVGGWEIDLKQKTIFLSEVSREIHEMDDSYIEPSRFEDMLTKRLSFYKEGPDRDRITKALHEAITEGTPFDAEVRIISTKGREIWVRVIGTPAYENGECIRIYGSFHDIDDLKTAQLALERVLRLTQQQNDRLQQFAYMVSHNLRSHAQNFSAMVDFLMSDYPRFGRTELGKNMKEMTLSLTETIQNLTEIAQMNTSGAQRLEEVNLSHTIESVLHSLKSQIISDEVSIINEIPENHRVMGIPAYMDSIVLNLLTNAIRYRSPDRRCTIRLSMSRAEKYDVFHVADNGLGIDLKRHGAKLFGMYKTFHNHPESRGIGLFITKNQVEVMGGMIQVDSKPGVGTTFRVSFLMTDSDPTGT